LYWVDGGFPTSSSNFGDERAQKGGQTGKSLPTFWQLLRRVEGTLAPKQNKTQADFFQLPDIIYGSYVLSWPLHEIRCLFGGRRRLLELGDTYNKIYVAMFSNMICEFFC